MCWQAQNASLMDALYKYEVDDDVPDLAPRPVIDVLAEPLAARGAVAEGSVVPVEKQKQLGLAIDELLQACRQLSRVPKPGASGAAGGLEWREQYTALSTTVDEVLRDFENDSSAISDKSAITMLKQQVLQKQQQARQLGEDAVHCHARIDSDRLVQRPSTSIGSTTDQIGTDTLYIFEVYNDVRWRLASMGSEP